MIKINTSIFYWNKLTRTEKVKLLNRPNVHIDNEIKTSVSQIISNVRKYGDSALHAYNLKFDRMKTNCFYISQKKISSSDKFISASFKDAINIAKHNIYKFHSKQSHNIDLDISTYPGVLCRHIVRPIHSVGLYVPKGSFPLVSTALMLLIPAQLAGCPNITLCSPPPISDKILYIAKMLNVETILELGGAHAISALALGTESIHRVDKIFGPGNAFVTEAKLQVSQQMPCTAIDMPAGPSEVLIIADQYAKPDFVASDLLSQAEHDVNSQVILVSTSIDTSRKIILELKSQLLHLSKKNIIQRSLENSKIIIAESLLECFEVSNLYAPEHLILHILNSENYLPYIKNAGSVFLGKWTPGSAGDYITGANHVLPTYGYSRAYSSLCVSDFQKTITIQKMTKIALQNLSTSISELSLSEGMDAHNKSVTIRTDFLKNKDVI